ncbi:hypothetical protein [Mycoplasma todarodis]|uniref:hypothetical protein n=1 Tax=Mycoplasma todarodis TaxID=1937191 RepID=UPI003B37647F
MKLKRKLLLTSSTLLVAATPVVAVVSCGDSNKINNNINDAINGQSKKIDVHAEDLRIIGQNGKDPIDGQASFKLLASPNKMTLLKEAGATYEYFVKYYKKGNAAAFEPVKVDPKTKLPLTSDLSIDDEVRLKIKLNKPGFEIGNKGVFTKKIQNNFRRGIWMNWFEPATKVSKEFDNMVSLTGQTININLESLDYMNNKYHLNELVFKIAKSLGYLFSDDPTRYVSLKKDNNVNPLTMADIWKSLDTASKAGVNKLVIKYKNSSNTIDLTNMNSVIGGNKGKINLSALIENGKKLLDKYKSNSILDDDEFADASIFTKNKIAQAFADEFKSVVTIDTTTTRLLTMIGPMKKDEPALNFIPELAVGYGNIFKSMMQDNLFKEWLKDNRFRDGEVENIANTFMATLFRVKPSN